MEQNQSKYRKSIADLKKVEAPDIWPRIRAELDSEGEENVGQLRKAIGALKEQEAPDIWMKVSEGDEEISLALLVYGCICVAVDGRGLLVFRWFRHTE